MDIVVRPETPADHAAIFGLTERAFAPMPYAGGDEQFLPGRFRDAGVLALSLVAELDQAVVGQITLTPALPEDGTGGWFALGPVSVEPELKHQGIGSRLIETAIAWMRQQGAAGCVLVGNPAYYSRFGFRLCPHLAPEDEPAEFYQMLLIGGAVPAHKVGFHPLFYGEAGKS